MQSAYALHGNKICAAAQKERSAFMKKIFLATTLSAVILASNFSQISVCAAVTDGINAADSSAVISEIGKLADDKEIIIDTTAFNNYSEVTLQKIAEYILDKRPDGGFKNVDDVQEAYDEATAEFSAIINHPMTGDIVITDPVDEKLFNGIGNDTPAVGKLSEFALTKDIDVDEKYISSVKYRLGNKASSGMCEAADANQPWNLYLTDGGFDEFGVTEDELGDRLTDTSRKLLTKNDRARSSNTFDITAKYKEYIGDYTESFAIRTQISELKTIFNTGNKIADNYIVYTIDTTAIAEDLKNITDEIEIEEFILKNGGALGIETGLYSRIPDKHYINRKLLGAEGDIETINAEISLAAKEASVGQVEVVRESNPYHYDETSTGQGVRAGFASTGSGAFWSGDMSQRKSVYVFDLTTVPTKYLMSAVMDTGRNSGGPAVGEVRQILAYTAVNDSMDFNRLNFTPVKDKLYSSNRMGHNDTIDVTDYLESGYFFVGLNGFDIECFENEAKLTLTYDPNKICKAFKTASKSEANKILASYGEMMGLTEEQLKQKSKIAIALSGADIENQEDFLLKAADAIVNIKQSDILDAINEASTQADFEELITELGSSLGLDIELVTNLDSTRQRVIFDTLYNNGAKYETVTQLSEKFFEVTDNVYEELLLAMDTTDIEKTKEFLQTNGKLLGITEEDLTDNIEILALAFANGREIKKISDFKSIYSNYEDEAIKSIVSMINRSEDIDKFNSLLREHATTLGINFNYYDKLEDKSGIFASLVGAADDRESFVRAYNNEISKYFAEPVVLYATDESMSYPASTGPDATDYQGWVGDYGQTNHFIKYDLSKINVAPETIVDVTIKMTVADRSELKDTKNKTANLHSIGTNWTDSVDYYATMQSKGVFRNSELVGSATIPGLVNGQTFEISVTDYVKKLLQEGAEQAGFQFSVVGGGLIMDRQGDKKDYAPLTIITIDSVPAEVTPVPGNGSKDVPINTGVKIDFGKEIASGTISNETITVTTADGVNVPCKISASGNVVDITFNKPLDYEVRYNVNISKQVKYANDNANYVFNSFSFVTEKKPFEFKGLVVKSGTKQISSLSERTGNTINASAVVNNNSSPESKKVIVMIGLYRNTGTYSELIDIKTVSRTLGIEQSANVSADFTIPEGDDVKVVCNVWDSLAEMNTLFTETMN